MAKPEFLALLFTAYFYRTQGFAMAISVGSDHRVEAHTRP